MTECDSAELLRRCVLAHLEAQRCADDIGVRILHFKGPFAVRDFPKRLGSHTDADILVEAGRVPELTDALVARGWSLYVDNREGLRGHGQVLIRDDRTCTIDLHHYFPGLRSEWDANFNALYADHETWDVLSSPPLSACSRIDHAILLILDTLADRIAATKIRDYRREAIWDTLSAAEQTALITRAKTLGVAELVVPLDAQVEFERDGLRRRRLMELQHRRELRGTAVWLQRLQDSETLTRKAKVLALAAFTVPGGGEDKNYVISLLHHWKRGAWQLVQILRQQLAITHRNGQLAKQPEAPVQPASEEMPAPTPQAAAQQPPTARPAPAPTALIRGDVVWYECEPWSVATMQTTTGKYIRLDGANALLWLNAAEQDSKEDAITTTLAAFTDPPADAAQQLQEAWAFLVEHQLLNA